MYEENAETLYVLLLKTKTGGTKVIDLVLEVSIVHGVSETSSSTSWVETGRFLLLWNFSVTISGSPYVYFILVLILISMFLRYYTYKLRIFHANRTAKCLMNHRNTKGEVKAPLP